MKNSTLQTIALIADQHCPELIKAMNDWIKDCQWGEDEFSDNWLGELSTLEKVKGINRHFDGGIKSFIIDCDLLMEFEDLFPSIDPILESIDDSWADF